MTPFEPGRIVLVAFPFTDHAGSKFRPALVVSSKAFNTSGDFIAVPITSQPDPHGYPIIRSDAFFGQTRLKGDSRVKWQKPMAISRRIVARTLGFLPDPVLKEIQEHIRKIFS